jgi:tryptophan synthase alpha chain
MRDADLDPVLIALRTRRPTLRATHRRSWLGYTYCVTRAGITGTHAEARFDSRADQKLRDAGAPPPVFGFGISRPPTSARACARALRASSAGSAIVSEAVERRDVAALVDSLKAATRNDSAPVD